MARVTAEQAARAALEAGRGGPAVAIVTVIAGPHAGERVILPEHAVPIGALTDAELEAHAVALAEKALRDGHTHCEDIRLASGDWTLFAEAHGSPEQLLIVGAGHIAVPLARLGIELRFRVTVLDDRDEYAAPARFPSEAIVVRADFETDPFAGLAIDERTYIALVTRGHQWDYACLERLLALRVQPRYIGMIGSRRRVRAAFHALLRAGVPRDRLAAVRAPIGLDIGAETPEEIAVSIAAELIRIRRGAVAPSLVERERVLERLLPERGADPVPHSAES
jgi:xanthine dehydrogenase accessory factor